MTLEELIYGRLTGSTDLQAQLTEYRGKPAVFYQQAPGDRDSGWKRDTPQYPRCVYIVDTIANPERHSTGLLTVDAYAGSDKRPEELVPPVKQALQDIILQTDGRPYAIAWERTEIFELDNAQAPNTLINGAMMTFSLVEFPKQETRTPDPAKGMEEFIHMWDQDVLILGRDRIENVYEPSNKCPAFYVRIAGSRTNHETFALRWIDCQIAVHVIAPDPEGRAGWVRYFADSLDYAGEVTLLDGSPMLIKSIEVDNSADYLTRGQITIQAQYSMPMLEHYTHPLKNAYITSD